MLLLMAIWQSSAARWQLTTLLGLVAVAWMLHGWLCKIKTSLTAGLLALLVASTLLFEGAWISWQISAVGEMHVDVERLNWIEWISCSRSMIMSGVGLLCGVVGVWLTRHGEPPASGRVRTRQALDGEG